MEIYELSDSLKSSLNYKNIQLNKIRKRMHKQSEKFKKEIEIIKINKTKFQEMNSTMTEIKFLHAIEVISLT